MADESDWSDAELQASVAAYLEMLRLEQNHVPYSKAEVRRKLHASSLAQRNDGSIEYRMQNISFVMEAMGLPRIAGYKPARNVGAPTQQRLQRFVEEAGVSSLAKAEAPARLEEVVPAPDAIMGVKAVFGTISSHVLCFGARGTINERSYFSVAAGAARRAVKQPYVIAIAGGHSVQEGLEGRVVNLARVALVYGPTKTLVTDPAEVARLAQWPVALALHDVWRFVGAPHLVEDLGFPDRTILAGAQDGIVRPEGAVERLWMALKDWPMERAALPLPGNFYDADEPKLVMSKLPGLPPSAGSEEGEKIWALQRKAERDPKLARDAKRLNAERHGKVTCQSCEFAHDDTAMFDAHHPTPLAAGKRTTLAEHLEILCPTCHRRAHRKSRLQPYALHELREWVKTGRP